MDNAWKPSLKQWELSACEPMHPTGPFCIKHRYTWYCLALYPLSTQLYSLGSSSCLDCIQWKAWEGSQGMRKVKLGVSIPLASSCQVAALDFLYWSLQILLGNPLPVTATPVCPSSNNPPCYCGNMDWVFPQGIMCWNSITIVRDLDSSVWREGF
jgi:hypothetical protein